MENEIAEIEEEQEETESKAEKKVGFEYKSKSIGGSKLYRYNISKKAVSDRNQR